MWLPRAAITVPGLLFLVSAPALPGEFCFDVDLPIPDNGQIVSEQDIVSSEECPEIDDLNVLLGIDHTRVGDLRVSLGYSGGATTPHTEVLLDRPGVPASASGCEGDDVRAVIDDNAVIAAEVTCSATPPAIGGPVIGGDPPDPTLLEAFAGDSPCGIWTLTVEDLADGETGILNEWCFSYTLAPGSGVPASGYPTTAALAVVMLALIGLFVRRWTTPGRLGQGGNGAGPSS
jgi:hypothetical protein